MASTTAANQRRSLTETIRRDLSDLQNQRRVRRVHVGAVPWNTQGFEPLVAVRNDQRVEAMGPTVPRA